MTEGAALKILREQKTAVFLTYALGSANNNDTCLVAYSTTVGSLLIHFQIRKKRRKRKEKEKKEKEKKIKDKR